VKALFLQRAGFDGIYMCHLGVPCLGNTSRCRQEGRAFCGPANQFAAAPVAFPWMPKLSRKRCSPRFSSSANSVNLIPFPKAG